MDKPRINIRITWRYCVALYCVVMLWASLHELVHHFAGFVACGAWGYKSFNYFETACEGSFGSYMATLAGPLFSFAAMWLGWWLLSRLRSSELHRQLGFAMIFAQLPFQRITGPLLRQNDEFYAATHLFGYTSTTRWMTFVVICAFCIPPLAAAWRAIENKRRTAWFLFYFLLFPYLLFGPVFFALEYLLTQKHVLDGRTIGIANLFIVNEVVTIVAYFAVKRWLVTGQKSSAEKLEPPVVPPRPSSLEV